MAATLRRSEARGRTQIAWLDSRHSFSFGSYYDPKQPGYRDLRVINEDWIAPDRGFGFHPHRDMEILTYVVSGELRHEDSMGHGSTLSRGDVQRMSAGTGIVHSEVNPSSDETLHLLQIWLQPRALGLEPGYEEAHISDADKLNSLALLASPEGDGALTIHQDVRLYASILEPGEALELPLAAGRHGWLQLISGALSLGDAALRAGDGIALEAAPGLRVEAQERAEWLLFDLR